MGKPWKRLGDQQPDQEKEERLYFEAKDRPPLRHSLLQHDPCKGPSTKSQTFQSAGPSCV